MKKKLLIAFAVLLLPVVAFAATQTYKVRSGDTLSSVAAKYGMTVEQLALGNPNAVLASGQKLTVTAPAPTPTPTPTPTPVPGGETVLLNVYTTGYGYPDNTPRNSAAIALPVLHSKAGGTGTYLDPITLAVGHVIANGNDTPDFPAGTKFYIPNLRKYFIVEDLCGDGKTPQNGPCHNISSADTGATLWLDLWVGGVGKTANGTIACEEAITANHTVIQNPASNYAVVPGEVYNGTCQAQFGDAVVTQ